MWLISQSRLPLAAEDKSVPSLWDSEWVICKLCMLSHTKLFMKVIPILRVQQPWPLPSRLSIRKQGGESTQFKFTREIQFPLSCRERKVRKILPYINSYCIWISFFSFSLFFLLAPGRSMFLIHMKTSCSHLRFSAVRCSSFLSVLKAIRTGTISDEWSMVKIK